MTGAVHGSPPFLVYWAAHRSGRGWGEFMEGGSVALGPAPFLGASGHSQHSRTKFYSCRSPDPGRLSLSFLRGMGWAGSWVMSQTLRWSQLLRGQISAPSPVPAREPRPGLPPRPSVRSCSLKGPLEAQPPSPPTLPATGSRTSPLANPAGVSSMAGPGHLASQLAPRLPAPPPAHSNACPLSVVPRQGQGFQET